MPRIYDKDRNPLDFCYRCWQESDRVIDLMNDPDADYDADHPPYEGIDYKCEDCKKLLTEKDD